MRFLGYLLAIGGLAAFLYTGINYINNSESFSAMGVDVMVSKGDPVPVIISVVVFLIGFFIIRVSKND